MIEWWRSLICDWLAGVRKKSASQCKTGWKTDKSMDGITTITYCLTPKWKTPLYTWRSFKSFETDGAGFPDHWNSKGKIWALSLPELMALYSAPLLLIPTLNHFLFRCRQSNNLVLSWHVSQCSRIFFWDPGLSRGFKFASTPRHKSMQLPKTLKAVRNAAPVRGVCAAFSLVLCWTCWFVAFEAVGRRQGSA